MGREYVEGRRLEPGDREGAAAEALKIDMRTLDEQREEAAKRHEETRVVKITIPSDAKPAEEEKPAAESKPSVEVKPSKEN